MLLTDVAGVLDKNGELVERAHHRAGAPADPDGSISGGMIPKIEGCIEVVEAGVEAVVIIDGRVPHCVLLELFTAARRRHARGAQGEEGELTLDRRKSAAPNPSPACGRGSG